MRRFSPYDDGAAPVPFSFDLSYNYYPPEYERPGPTVTIQRLRDCEQAFGPPILRVPRGARAGAVRGGARAGTGGRDLGPLPEGAQGAQGVALEVPVPVPCGAASQSVAKRAYIRPRFGHQVPTGSGPPLHEPAE